MTELCGLINQAAWNALIGPNPPEYVATFGNSDVEVTGDWVPILGVTEPSAVSSLHRYVLK